MQAHLRKLATENCGRSVELHEGVYIALARVAFHDVRARSRRGYAYRSEGGSYWPSHRSRVIQGNI